MIHIRKKILVDFSNKDINCYRNKTIINSSVITKMNEQIIITQFQLIKQNNFQYELNWET